MILHNAPGGGLGAYLQNPHITQADITRLKHNLGLDKPLPVQYFIWLGHSVTGDFGWSMSNSEPVFNAIVERLPATFELMISSFVLAFIIGVSAGLFAAVRPYSVWDYFITTFAFFGQSMPVFWFAVKVFFFMFLYIWIRGTLPRFRYDQLMAFGWKFLLPLAIANIIVTSFIVAWRA